MRRYAAVVASFFIMLCLGGVYAWSIFVPMLKKQLGYSTSQTQLIVGLTFGIFALSMIFAGQLEKKYGPKLVAAIGAGFLLAGYYIAYASGGEFLIVCLSIGGLCGIGTGCCYVCCLVTPAKNFSENKGLATGIAVGGFGAGAILMSYLVKFIIAQSPDITVLELFRSIGLSYAAIMFLSVFFLNYPVQTSSTNISSLQAFNPKETKFWVLFITMFAGTFAGLLILGNAKPIALSLGYTEDIATLSITLLALGNMSGRVIWGLVLDKIGVDLTLAIAYIILIVATILLNFIAPSELLLYLILIMVGLGFSANMVLFAAKTAQLYGVEKLGLVYPFIFLAYGIAGVIGPFMGGWLFDLQQNYSLAIIISCVMTCIGLCLYQLSVKKINAI